MFNFELQHSGAANLAIRGLYEELIHFKSVIIYQHFFTSKR